MQTYPVLEFRELAQRRAGPFAPLGDRDVQELLSPTQDVLEHVGSIPRKAHRDPAADDPPDGAGAAFAKATPGL